MKTCYANERSRAIADLILVEEKVYLLTRINVPKSHRGLGYARLLLKMITTDADADGVTLLLEVAPSDGLDYAQLSAWYERHGFMPVGGILMRREPQKKE